MAERASSGGEKEFVYTTEHLRKIRSEDTESTRRFKRSLNAWAEKKADEKAAKRKTYDRIARLLYYLSILLGATVIIVFILTYWRR